MKIAVEREACCAADDQAGPLEMTVDIPTSATLHSLAEQIRKSGFLQYSASHHTIFGATAGRRLLSISSQYHSDGKVVYFTDQAKTVQELLPDGRLRFTFPG